MLMSHSSASIFKSANNALLAQRVSSINSIANICQQFNKLRSGDPVPVTQSSRRSSLDISTPSGGSAGSTSSEELAANRRTAMSNPNYCIDEANLPDILQALSLNSCLSSPGSNYCQASLGYGGSCLDKDTLQFAKFAARLQLPPVYSDFWYQPSLLNQRHLESFIKKLFTAVDHDVTRLAFGFVGYAYKQGTADTRGSLVKPIVQHLMDSGAAQIKIWDPLAPATAIRRDILHQHDPGYRLCMCTGIEEVFKHCAVVVVVNECEELTKASEEDWKRIGDSMGLGVPRVVFDPRNCLRPENYGNSHGIRFEQMGRAKGLSRNELQCSK